MSEPLQKGEIDLSSLDQALNESGTAQAAPSESLQQHSSTLAQPAIHHHAGSPATLSPSSARSLSPNLQATEQSDVVELKNMFPELDPETISAVLSSRGGNQDAAVNALLQMSDPDFKPAKHETQTETDAMLAQSIAMDEEQRHHELLSKQQQRTSAGRGGGGAASFLEGILGSSKSDAAPKPPPNYDPSVLTYQPRVRKPPPASRFSAASGPSMTKPPGPSYEDSVIPGLPGPREAKQWQEGINKMAETGLARAASTFSSLKQKANAAFNAPPGSDAEVAAGTDTKTPAFQGFQQTNWTYTAESKAPTGARGLRSPRSPHASEYDRDPSPVSDNELAKLIGKGGGSSARTNPIAAGSGTKAKTLADRYGLGIRSQSGSTGAKSGSSSAAVKTEPEHYSWDQAGRAPVSTRPDTEAKVSALGKDPIAMMDNAQGRGVSSPRRDRSPVKGDAAVMQTSSRHGIDRHSDDNDSDDLEYVSNPFEDED